MNGRIEQVGTGFAVYVEEQLVCILPTRESAEEYLIAIYLFDKDRASDGPIQ